MNDSEITLRLLNGDPEIVELVRSWIRTGAAPYRARLAADLEDLEQETLLDLTRALSEGKFRGKSQLSTYVRTYVHHKCIDRLRALARREWIDVEDLDLPSPAPTALEELTQAESIRLALRVLEEMPESCRELWRMLRQGLRYREMSHRLGIAEGALRARVLRCRRQAIELRERFLEEAGNKSSGPSTK